MAFDGDEVDEVDEAHFHFVAWVTTTGYLYVLSTNDEGRSFASLVFTAEGLAKVAA